MCEYEILEEQILVSKKLTFTLEDFCFWIFFAFIDV